MITEFSAKVTWKENTLRQKLSQDKNLYFVNYED